MQDSASVPRSQQSLSSAKIKSIPMNFICLKNKKVLANDIILEWG